MGWLIRRALNYATEGVDLVDAIWEAIPWKDRLAYHQGKRKPTPQDKLGAIYDKFDKIDWSDALQNVIENQLEDMAFGKAGKATGKATRRNVEDGISPNIGRGPQSGPWDTQAWYWLFGG